MGGGWQKRFHHPLSTISSNPHLKTLSIPPTFAYNQEHDATFKTCYSYAELWKWRVDKFRRSHT